MELLTHSAMSSFRNCRKKYQYRYEMNLVPKTTKPALRLGTAVHKGLEEYYLGVDVESCIESAFGILTPQDTLGWGQEDFDRLAVQKATAEGMLLGYNKRFDDRGLYEQIMPEYEFCIPLINPETGAPSKTFQHAGKLDGLFKLNGQWFVGEFKTASQVGHDYLERLKLDTQITSYLAAAQLALGIKIAGVIYKILKKPSIKQTQKETVQQYCERLIADYQTRTDFYFHQEILYRTQDDLTEYGFEKWEVAKDILDARRTGRFYKNTSMCSLYGLCEYMPICTGGQQALAHYETRAPHEELSEKEKTHGNATAIAA